MTALEIRREPLDVVVEPGPLDGLVADAREVAVALAALRAHSGRRGVRIPTQAFRVVEALGTYGD
jgi:hypothetical protein